MLQTNLGMKKEEIVKAAIDAYSKGLTNAKDFYEDAKKFLIDEASCDNILGETVSNLHQFF